MAKKLKNNVLKKQSARIVKSSDFKKFDDVVKDRLDGYAEAGVDY